MMLAQAQPAQPAETAPADKKTPPQQRQEQRQQEARQPAAAASAGGRTAARTAAPRAIDSAAPPSNRHTADRPGSAAEDRRDQRRQVQQPQAPAAAARLWRPRSSRRRPLPHRQRSNLSPTPGQRRRSVATSAARASNSRHRPRSHRLRRPRSSRRRPLLHRPPSSLSPTPGRRRRSVVTSAARAAAADSDCTTTRASVRTGSSSLPNRRSPSSRCRRAGQSGRDRAADPAA